MEQEDELNPTEEVELLLPETEEELDADRFLEEAGHAVLPDYLNGQKTDPNQLARAIRNTRSVRELFAAEARVERATDPRAPAAEFIRLAEFGYFGMDGDQCVRFSSESERYVTYKSLKDLAKPLRSVYRESTGILQSGGLKAWIGFRTDSESREELLCVGFSGTSFNFRMIEADLKQVVYASEIYLRAAGLIRFLSDRFPSHRFVLAGHSLGGGLAQFSLAANVSNAAPDRYTAFCYNAAGLNYIAYENLKDRLPIARDHIYQYRVEGEPVSACFGQIGQIVMLPAPDKISVLERHRLSTVKRLIRTEDTNE